MSNFKKIVLATVFVLALFAVAVNAAPYWVTYPSGIQLTGGATYASTINTTWGNWKAKFAVASGTNGTRVKAPEAPHNGRTVSEGQAYGLILAVYMDDQATFDAMWKYKLYMCGLAGGKQLMPWATNTNGDGYTDPNSATDADTDMAFALIQASRRWGGIPAGQTLTYAQYATAMLNAIYSSDRKSDNHMGPGDNWDTTQYPSYY